MSAEDGGEREDEREREEAEPAEGGEGSEQPAPDSGESSGLGLTEEFERIEAEIEEEVAVGSSSADADAEAEADPEAEPTADAEEPATDSDPDPDAEGQDDVEDQSEPEAPAAGAGSGAAEAAEAAGPEAASAGEEDPDPPQPVERDPATVLQTGGRPAVRPMPQTAVPVALGAGADPAEPADKTPSLWLRFLTGSVLIIASVAASVAVAALLFLGDVAAKLQPIPGIQRQLSEVASDDPQTILIIGSDRRAGTDRSDRRSDTTMLLRVDPDKGVLSLFSLPRDLKVDIPGFGPAKLNEAYTLGGEKLTLKTVNRFTGLDELGGINHVVEINFSGFADAVNAIECVYIDVDREYFNDNSGLAPDQQYAEIDINAGYQRLCGLKALQYVRYRHTDTDLVRAARQQDFLREARQKVEPRELIPVIGGGNELIDIFTDYTRSDIADKEDLIGILRSFIAVRDVPVNEVHFEGDIGGPDDPFVTSTDKQVEKAIDEFLNGVGSEGQRGGEKANEKKSGGKKEKKKEKAPEPEDANVVPTDQLADEKFGTQAERLKADAVKNARRLKIPAFYPTELVPGSAFSPDSRTYEYKNENDKKEEGYKTVLTLGSLDTLTEYYGFSGTTWEDPPILRNPSETRKIDGREYLLYYDAGRLRMVGWKEKGNSYWLNNTLTQSIGEAEMLAMATSIKEA